jgi:acetoin utilization deacetylase AcuC-like enzyme
LAPAFRVAAFAPDVLVVALGLDASVDDPPAFLAVTGDGFRRNGAALAAPGLPTVLVQEGGYLSRRLSANLQATLGGFEEER